MPPPGLKYAAGVAAFLCALIVFLLAIAPPFVPQLPPPPANNPKIVPLIVSLGTALVNLDSSLNKAGGALSDARAAIAALPPAIKFSAHPEDASYVATGVSCSKDGSEGACSDGQRCLRTDGTIIVDDSRGKCYVYLAGWGASQKKAGKDVDNALTALDASLGTLNALVYDALDWGGTTDPALILHHEPDFIKLQNSWLAVSPAAAFAGDSMSQVLDLWKGHGPAAGADAVKALQGLTAAQAAFGEVFAYPGHAQPLFVDQTLALNEAWDDLQAALKKENPDRIAAMRAERFAPQRVNACSDAQDMLPPDREPAFHLWAGQGNRNFTVADVPWDPASQIQLTGGALAPGSRRAFLPINPVTRIGVTDRVPTWANPYVLEGDPSGPCSRAVSLWEVQPGAPGFLEPAAPDSTDGTPYERRSYYQPAVWEWPAASPYGGPYRELGPGCPGGSAVGIGGDAVESKRTYIRPSPLYWLRGPMVEGVPPPPLEARARALARRARRQV